MSVRFDESNTLKQIRSNLDDAIETSSDTIGLMVRRGKSLCELKRECNALSSWAKTFRDQAETVRKNCETDTINSYGASCLKAVTKINYSVFYFFVFIILFISAVLLIFVSGMFNWLRSKIGF